MLRAIILPNSTNQTKYLWCNSFTIDNHLKLAEILWLNDVSIIVLSEAPPFSETFICICIISSIQYGSACHTLLLIIFDKSCRYTQKSINDTIQNPSNQRIALAQCPMYMHDRFIRCSLFTDVLWVYLASYPGSLVGRREPGNHCMRMRQSYQENMVSLKSP